jgi:hypothetical protein
MYIGARYVPIFADPVEWDDEREYEPLTIVIHDGSCYTSKCYVPKGAQLPPYPEGQTKYWVKTSDYNYQFADLKKTVLDLSRLVEQFQKDNKTFTDLINGWNEKVQQWETEMTAWGERLDTVESNITDLTASLNAEIDRAKAAEQANAAAIAQETADRKQAISELDAAYKAADAAEAQTRKEADTALSNRITANKTDIDALKAEQAIQNTNISQNAKNISDNSAEIAKHAARLTDLESNASDWDEVFPDTTIAQEVQKEELERANADTALNGRCDTLAADVEEVRDIANHKVDTTTYTEGQAAQDTRIKALEGDNTTNKTDIENIKAKDTAQDAAIQQNKDTIAHVSGSLSGYVKTETYTEGQAAQDAKITAAQNAADKANTNIGDWETDHPGQTISQCATSLENETAANAAKADANAAVIGNWNAEHPGKTIAQAVTDVSGSIPDVSGFVTETTYNQGQAAQDAKITAAQNAANKANTTIGDWETEHPGQTISECATDLDNRARTNSATIGDWHTTYPTHTITQMIANIRTDLAGIDFLNFLNKLYPEGSIVPGGSFDSYALYPRFYYKGSSLGYFDIPAFVPDIVARFDMCWTFVPKSPTSISLLNAAGAIVETKTVTKCEILNMSDNPRLDIRFATPFTIQTTGFYYFQFGPVDRFGYSWKKNSIPLAEYD